MTPRFATHRLALLRASTIAGARDLPPWPQAPIGPDHQDVWIPWLNRVRLHPDLGPAIGDASPALAERLAVVCNGQGSNRDLARVARSCARYVCRAQGRATPFGHFAGVAPLAFTSSTQGDVGPHHRPVARVSAPWVAGALARVESCSPSCTDKLSIQANSLAQIRQGRLVLDHRPVHGSDRTSSTSVRLTPAVQLALEHTRSPTPWPRVEAALCATFPGGAENAGRMLAALLTQGFLLSDLRPPMAEPDPVRHLITRARAAVAEEEPAAAKTLASLEKAHAALAEHNTATEVGTRSQAKERARAHLGDICGEDPDLSIDLRLDSDLTLPRAVAWQAQGAGAVLARLAPPPRGTWHDYHHRFCERYGVGALVPLQELTDPDRGLGFPAGFRGSRLPAVPPEPVSARDAKLLERAQRSCQNGTRELEVDEAFLDEMGAEGNTVVPHTELRFQVHATSRQALDTGHFRIAVAGASRAAGTVAGRFLDLLPTADGEEFSDLYRDLPTLREDAIVAQLSAPASTRHGDQVARTTRVLDWSLPLGQHQTADPGMLDVDELAVTADSDHLHLVSTTHGRPVEPVVFSAIELSRAHPMQQFLAQLTTARSGRATSFSWGAASHLPFLPRVRWQQSILAPARWRLTASDLPGSEASLGQWSQELDRWRATFGAPSLVQMGKTDQQLRLNLKLAAHRQLLRSELESTGTTHLFEAPTQRDLGWIQGRAHEVVATLTTDSPNLKVRERPGGAQLHGPADEHLPGSTGWWTLNLHGDPKQAHLLITNALPRLSANGADRWWFLRYQDPDPHLRVRIHVEDRAQAEAVLNWGRQLRQQGSIARIVHDTYVPETGRFGHGDAMETAEGVFVADSRAVAAQVATDSAPEQVRVWAAASALDLTRHVVGDARGARSWLIAHAPRTSPPRDEAAAAIALTGPEARVPEPIGEAWSDRAHALAAYSGQLQKVGFDPARILPDLLHLHCVRLFGPDSAAETQILSLARACALSWNAREASR